MTQWDKLLNRIYALSKDLRFHELRKVLKVMDIKCIHRVVAAVTIHFVNRAVSLLQYQNMNLSKKCM